MGTEWKYNGIDWELNGNRMEFETDLNGNQNKLKDLFMVPSKY